MGSVQPDDEFGIITMAPTEDAVVRACALAASVRLNEPGVPIGLLELRGLSTPSGYFDFVRSIDSPEPFSGRLRYLNKLKHPFEMSPFSRTLFLDDDTLVVRPLRPVIERHFRGHPLAMNTQLNGPSTRRGMNHVDPRAVCEAFGLERCTNTYGGGHMYFEASGEWRPLVDRAISYCTEDFERYEALSSQTVISDEVALMLAANEAGIMMPHVADLVDAFSLAQANEIRVDVENSRYAWDQRPWGTDITEVRLLHFCSNAKRSLPYGRAIRRLTGLRQSFDRGPAGAKRRASIRAHRYVSPYLRRFASSSRATSAR